MIFIFQNKVGLIFAISILNLEIMMLKESKIPKWKEKENKFKSQSFDDSLEALGANGAFINAKQVNQAIVSPTQTSKKELCED